MSNLSFVQLQQDYIDSFNEIAVSQFELKRKILGTTIIRKRVVSSSKYLKVLGSAYTSNNLNDSEITESQEVILLNTNNLRERWDLSKEETVIDNREVFQRGDIVIYARKTVTYMYKVTDVKNLTDTPQIYYEYTLTPIKETRL